MNPLSHAERIQALDEIEKNVYQMMHQASHSLSEFAKDKPSAKNVENQVNTFLKQVETVESGLDKQLQYLFKASTLYPHEGSCYASNKIKELALMRAEYLRAGVARLERMKMDHIQENQRLQASIVQKDAPPAQPPQ